MIELGVRARDKVTGFEGIITGCSQWLTGCDQYVIVPPATKDGKMDPGQWFDEGRIEVLGQGVSIASVTAAKAGGPQRDLPTKS